MEEKKYVVVFVHNYYYYYVYKNYCWCWFLIFLLHNLKNKQTRYLYVTNQINATKYFTKKYFEWSFTLYFYYYTTLFFNRKKCCLFAFLANVQYIHHHIHLVIFNVIVFKPFKKNYQWHFLHFFCPTSSPFTTIFYNILVSLIFLSSQKFSVSCNICTWIFIEKI